MIGDFQAEEREKLKEGFAPKNPQNGLGDSGNPSLGAQNGLLAYEEPHQVKRSIFEKTNQINDFGSFELTEGINPPESPGRLGLASAVYESHTIGIIHSVTGDLLTSQKDDLDYDPIHDIPDRYLNEQDVGYFIDAPNRGVVESRITKLDREKRNDALVAQYPGTYFSAAFAAGFVDPLNWLLPGSSMMKQAKAAYALKQSGQAAMSAKVILGAGLEAGLLTGTSVAIQEALMLQTQLTREIEDSAYGIITGTLVGGLIGSVAPSIIAGTVLEKASGQITKVIAGNDPTMTKAPKSKLFAMDATDYSQMIGEDVVVSLPDWVKKIMSISPAGGLRNSKSFFANMVAADMSTTPLIVDKNITKNKASQEPVDGLIAQMKNKTRRIMVDVNEIFMEQQGLSGGLFKGIRSRIAEGRQGLGREEFSISMQETMESGVASPHESVNRAVTRVKEYLQESKEELVELGLLNKKFLDPQFDNYFTRHWLKNEIIKNHEDFRNLLFKWYNECLQYYKVNKAKLDPLKKKVDFAQKEFDVANRNMARVVQTPEYKKLQAEKKAKQEQLRPQRQAAIAEKKRLRAEEVAHKKELAELKKLVKQGKQKKGDLARMYQLEKELPAKTEARKKANEPITALRKEGQANKLRRHKRQAELDTRIKKFKSELDQRTEKLLNAIDPKYLTPDGHIPSTDKTPLDLHAAVMQTFYRTTGNDIELFMNPVVGGGGGGKPDPLQQRVLTIPHDYSMQTFDGRTVKAQDFFNKDIWSMLDNYGKQTAATTALTRLAKARGLTDENELRAWYLQNVRDDYQDMLRGVSGDKATKLENKREKDLTRVNNVFDQQYGIAGKDFNIFGPGAARFVNRLRQYNAGRMLGSAMLSSIPDLVVAPFRQGLLNYSKDFLIPVLKDIVKLRKNKAFGINKRDLNDAGYALNTQIGQMAKAFIDNSTLLIEQKWWRNLSEPLVNSFGNVTGLSQLSDLVESIGGHVSISRSLRTIVKKIEKGRMSEKDRIRLRQIGISEESEKHLFDMWKESGGIESGAYYSNHGRWNLNNDKRIRAFQEFTGSIQTDISHSTLRASKGELPIWADSLLGKLVLHFKDYLFAATSKLVLSGMQKIGQRDFEVMLAIAANWGMGCMSYVMTSLAKDPTKELDLSYEKLLKEGLDRSALLGIFMEPINMFQKQGWLPGQAPSRYFSRGAIGTWLGPEIGMLDELINTIGKPIANKAKGTGAYTTRDALGILRLLPFQNLWYLRYLNEQVARNAAESLGATPKD